MSPMHRTVAGLVSILWLGGLATASANPVLTRTFSLQAGWNAIYLDVRPTNTAAGAVLAGLPLQSAWRPQQRLTAVDFIQDPNEAV